VRGGALEEKEEKRKKNPHQVRRPGAPGPSPPPAARPDNPGAARKRGDPLGRGKRKEAGRRPHRLANAPVFARPFPAYKKPKIGGGEKGPETREKKGKESRSPWPIPDSRPSVRRSARKEKKKGLMERRENKKKGGVTIGRTCFSTPLSRHPASFRTWLPFGGERGRHSGGGGGKGREKGKTRSLLDHHDPRLFVLPSLTEA